MNDDNNPFIIIAWGLFIGLALTGLGLLLKWVIPAFGAMTVVPAMSVGIAIGGLAIGITVFSKVVIQARKNPYEWTLPILAIISGLVIDTCKELYQIDSRENNGIIRIVYGASVSGLFLIGGILWRQKKVRLRFWASKFAAIILFLLPPLLIFLRYAQFNKLTLLQASRNIITNSNHIIWSIVILLILLFLTTMLSWVFKE